ncbi:MAG: DUF4827 domain-containing protein [Muribaculum sp.]|nr:DUF4827 domain-containing protein [Muribaculaceae bacterium]MCM1080578.1 DUF4827 domain-containing protein [Muribaculum sp.]
MKLTFRIFALGAIALAQALTFSSCDDNKSYADRLEEETKYINRYLADQKVIGHKPKDNQFIVGPDAPYYRMDADGLVYMQVISKGNMEDMAEVNDLVYIRFTRYNLADYSNGELPDGTGNADDVTYSEQFRYQNSMSQSTVTWGDGIQVPLEYLGYGCEVNLVIRSQAGRNEDIANVIPYLYNVRYYKSRIG